MGLEGPKGAEDRPHSVREGMNGFDTVDRVSRMSGVQDVEMEKFIFNCEKLS